ncbi:ATP-binding protein [Couchioplanes caeruleus]|uniref:XRE family transcriptional regulator n=2 Tax=Couchioplanes caeruleus TaxID=56438 RepID=A0A1K0GR76_9ACTN|nr:helix-turn-helix domain-containing protein [Couchioplanes caeruleus]OJF14910.1 XRE family transcriptional regulator [Couchioplanes caeruleus subsp. caeruleus]ROP31081.1 putative ATPase [Couchioplanes caeruleus]
MTSDHGADQEGPGFDAVLRSYRLRATLTQEELAARAAVGVRTVRDLERGRASRPQRTTAELLAAALGLAGADRLAFLAAARGHSSRTQPPPRYVRLPPASDLIGRDDEVTQLVTRLSRPPGDGSRGITLVGLAGVGKTSLALTVSHRVTQAYPGGVAGVVVTDGSTAGEVLGGVAAVFGVGRPDDLAPRFAGRSALLLIDAVDRAPEALAEALGRLLTQHPTLRFLATGRHPIGLPSERVQPVAPLVAPPEAAGTTLAEAAGYPAVALFLDRLAQVRGTPVDPDEVGPLVALVRRLGGLPIALELAAARGRVLTVAEILDRYGDRVLDLSGRPADGGVVGARDLEGRPTDTGVVSVRDAVAASYRLLSIAERKALHRLATFRNRWSLDLAEKIIDRDPTVDVVHLLDRFLELGLLSARGARAFRFRLLDVVGDYACEQAAALGDLPSARRRHAEVMADLALSIAPDLKGAHLAEAAARLDDVSGDLGAALTYAAKEDPHTALHLAACLPRWWRFRGRDVTGRQWLRRLLADPRTADADPAIRAWAKVGLAQLALEHGSGAEEIGSAQAALTEFAALGDVAGQLMAHTQLAALWMTAHGYDRARAHGEAALELARRSGRIRDMAVAENNLTWHEIREGNLPAARARLAEVDKLAGRCGEHRLRAVAVANLAEVERLDGRCDEAARLGRHAIAELEDVGDPGHRRRVLATIGLALAEAGRTRETEGVLAELRPADAGAPADGPVAVVEGALALLRGDERKAAELFEVAAAAYEGGHDPRDTVEAVVGLIRCTREAEKRAKMVHRLHEMCRTSGIALLPRDLKLIGASAE